MHNRNRKKHRTRHHANHHSHHVSHDSHHNMQHHAKHGLKHGKRKVQRNKTLDLLVFLLLVILATTFFIPLKEYFAAKMLSYTIVSEGVLEDKIATEGVIIYESKVVQTSVSGQWQPVVAEGERVAAGTLVGYVNAAIGKKPLYAGMPGAVSYQIDGLESVLTPAQAEDVDLDNVLTLLAEEKKTGQNQPNADGSPSAAMMVAPGKGIFKMIDNLSDVYFLVKVKDAAKTVDLEPGELVRIRLPEAEALQGQGEVNADTVDVIDKRLSATVVSLRQNDKGTQILFKIRRNDIVLSGERKMTVDILVDRLEGNMVPNKAIFYNQAGKPCVYVVKRNRLALSEVKVIGTVEGMSVIEGVSAGTAVVNNPSLATEQQKVYFK